MQRNEERHDQHNIDWSHAVYRRCVSQLLKAALARHRSVKAAASEINASCGHVKAKLRSKRLLPSEPSEPVMPVFFSVLVQYQTFLIAVKQMHVVDSLGIVFLLGATFWLDEFA